MRFEARQLLRIFILLVSLGLCVSSARTIYDLWRRQDIVLERKAELESVKERQNALKVQLEDTKSDAYVEREARNKLGMVKEGETIVILPESERDSSGSEIRNGPIWRQWLELFF